MESKARNLYRIPEGVQPVMAQAIGYATDPDTLPENYRGRVLASRTWKMLAEFVFGSECGAATRRVK